MKSRELQNLGIPHGEPIRIALATVGRAMKNGMTRDAARAKLAAIADKPEDHVNDPAFADAMTDRLLAMLAAR